MQHFRFLALALCVMTGVCSATPGAAQVTINGNYYEETKSASCSISECVIEFTPPTSRVRFTKINCLVSSLPTDLLAFSFGVRDSANGTMRRIEFLPFGNPATGPTGNRFYTVLAPSDFLFAPGKIPTAYGTRVLGSTSGGYIHCKLTGHVEA